jgi:DNA invertase Pin-like site-specific DNA recombinase
MDVSHSEGQFLGIYLRKSRDKAEAADPELLSKHKRELLRLAESKGDAVPPHRVFEEVGSGEKIDRRPVFLQLLEEIERLPRNAGGRLYTTEVSRLTRGDLAARGRIQGALQRAAIRHITRGKEYDLSSADDRFVWEIEAGVSGYELGRYKQRVEAARMDMALEGKIRTGKPPMGWTWDKNLERPVPNHLFPVVQALCRDALSLSTYELSEKYHLPQATILNLLRNPFIAGWPAKRWFPHNGDRDWVGPSHLLKADQWIWPKEQADYEAACPLEEWHEIQRTLDKRRDLREKRNSDEGWCRDIVRFQGYEQLQPRLGTWKCPRVQVLTYELAPPGIPRLYIARDLVHQAAEAEVLSILRDSPGLQRLIAAPRKAAQPPIDYGALDREASALERKLGALEGILADVVANGNAERAAAINAQCEEVSRELKRLRQQARSAAPPIAFSPAAQEMLALLTFLPDRAWSDMPPTARRIVAQALLARVLVVVEPRGKGFGTGYRREVLCVERRHTPCIP